MRPLLSVFVLCLSATVCMAQGNSVATLRTNVRLTTVDVVVTDGKGNPVHGLKQEDFDILENKKAQRIASFEEHAAPHATAYEKPRPGVFTNATAARGGVNNVLLVDFLNTPGADQKYLRTQLVKFILGQPAGTRTAVFAMSGSLHLVQDFTSDPAELKAMLLKLGTQFSPLADPKSVTQESTKDAYLYMLQNNTGGSPEDNIGKLQVLNDIVTREQSMQIRNNALLTMSELTDVARNLVGVNGRKNVYWLSGSFPSFVQRDISTTGSPFKGNEDMSRELSNTMNSLASAQVTLYPIDSRGQSLSPSQTGDLSNVTNYTLKQAANSSTSFTPEDDAFRTAQFNEHTTMNELAEATGGKAYYNTNDITGAIADAEKLGSQFYTLTYTPPLDAKPGEYRDIKVNVRGRGLHLSYRRGYYAAGSTNGKAVPLNTPKTARAMQAQSPQSSEVLFQVEVSRSTPNSSAKVIGGPVFDNLPHDTYQLNALIDFGTLQFSPDADGKMHGVVDVATVVYDKSGKVLDSRTDRASLTLDDARYQAMRKGGMRFHQIVAVPDKGDGYVRMAVHDATTDKLGTVQISMANVRDAARSAH